MIPIALLAATVYGVRNTTSSIQNPAVCFRVTVFIAGALRQRLARPLWVM
jgi:hypothetical protein